MLAPRDRDFIDALRSGVSAAQFAREHGYSSHWAKWRSREIRARLGAATMEEVVSEITREEIDGLRRDVSNALEALKAARTPADRRDAERDYRDAKSDLDEELRRLGLSRDDLEKVREEKEYERYKRHQSRLDQEREAEAARKADEDAKAEAERIAAEEAEKAASKRDGLGGRRNR